MVSFLSNNYSGRICILANSDIYFDNSLQNYSKFDLNKSVLCLSRYDIQKDNVPRRYDCKGEKCCLWSQDSWIFRAPLSILTDPQNISLSEVTKLKRIYDFLALGTPQCDHIWAFILLTSGYSVINPCVDIKSYHLHKNNDQRNKNIQSDKQIQSNNQFSYYIPSMYS